MKSNNNARFPCPITDLRLSDYVLSTYRETHWAGQRVYQSMLGGMASGHEVSSVAMYSNACAAWGSFLITLCQMKVTERGNGDDEE